MRVEGEARRKRSGSGWRYTIDGEPVDSVTRIIREGVPAPQFAEAAAKNVAGYTLDHWAELADLTPSKRHDAMIRARWAERDAAAGRGTQVHALAQQLAAGAEVEVPDALVGYVDAYLGFAEAYRVDEIAVEQTVVYRGATLATSYMGTLDLLARLDGEPEVVLLDWKTGGSGIWPEAALQLSAYAHAQTMLAADGSEVPLPAIARAAAVWLRADGYDVYPLDIGPETFRTFQYAQQMAAYKGLPRERFVAAALGARTGVAS